MAPFAQQFDDLLFKARQVLADDLPDLGIVNQVAAVNQRDSFAKAHWSLAPFPVSILAPHYLLAIRLTIEDDCARSINPFSPGLYPRSPFSGIQK
jgi:hypothetical protein